MDGRAAGFGCFCCFRTDLSAIDISSSAAFLGRRPFGDLKNSENDGCSVAVLCGFRLFAVFAPRLQASQAVITARPSRQV
jgi:hypothetical protein